MTIVIPSRNEANLKACVAAIRSSDLGARIIVVWDRSKGNAWLPPTADYFTRDVEADFVFSRNCNIGIAAAAPDGVLLLNDDALLRSRKFSFLEHTAEERPEYGVIAATTNVTGYSVQWRRSDGLREAECVAFVCVYIPRRTIEMIGLLDERFVAYGSEDIDYCRRVRRAGLKIGVHDDCYVDHGTLPSTFRPWAPGNMGSGDIAAGQRILAAKWGVA